MKKEKGITLTSLTIHIIILTIVIAVISTISSYFYKQIHKTIEQNQNARSFTTFMSYFVQDIEEEGNDIKKQNLGTENIEFTNNNKYFYSKENKSIYNNEIKICENVDNCSFNIGTTQKNKSYVEVNFQSGEFNKTIKFIMNKT